MHIILSIAAVAYEVVAEVWWWFFSMPQAITESPINLDKPINIVIKYDSRD